MGGKELEEDASSVLQNLQHTLNVVLDTLANIFAMRYVFDFVFETIIDELEN